MAFSHGLTDEEIRRYARHIVLPEVGEKGQAKLKESSVLIVGAGGLGSPVALYLAAAGVGCLGLIDSDVVDASNLQRQVIHDTSQVGKPKVESAAQRIRKLNPNVRVDVYYQKLTSANAELLVSRYDVAVTAVDNLSARYLLNDACVLSRKPLVEAGVLHYDGMITTIKPGVGPCYRCLFPEPPAGESALSPSNPGILAPLPGVMGTLQTFEVLKLLLGIGEPLVGRLLMFDGLDSSFREVRIQRNPMCPVCGDKPTITKLKD